MLEEEKNALFLLPPYIFDTAKSLSLQVDSFATVGFDKNSYSVPVEFRGKIVEIKTYPEEIKVFYNGEVIVSHNRCLARNNLSIS